MSNDKEPFNMQGMDAPTAGVPPEFFASFEDAPRAKRKVKRK